MMDVDQALGIVLAQCRSLPVDTIEVANALFRTLAQPIATDIDQPPFDRSLMDGYAVRADDIASSLLMSVVLSSKFLAGLNIGNSTRKVVLRGWDSHSMIPP